MKRLISLGLILAAQLALGQVTYIGNHIGNGAGVTNLNATNIATGTLSDSRLSTNVALLNSSVWANYLTTATYNLGWGSLPTNIFSGYLLASTYNNNWGAIPTNALGSSLPTTNASLLVTGTLPDARLSGNVVTNTKTGVSLNGTFTGDGSGLSGIVSTETNVPNYVLTNTTEIWLFTNATAYVNGHWTNWPSSTTAGIQECHNLLQWVSNAQPTITIHFAGNTIFKVSTPIYLTNEMTFKGAGKVSSIIEWVGPTGWTSLQGVADHPELNAMISMPWHGVGAGNFPISMGNFVCLDMGFQTATDFPLCLLANAAEHSDIERCAFLGPHAFSPNGNYRMLVLKNDMATSPSAVVGLAYSGMDKATIRGNVFAGLAVGFFAYSDGNGSGDHYEFSENDGGSIGEYAGGAYGNAYGVNNVLSTACLLVDNGGKAGRIVHNHATWCNGLGCVAGMGNWYAGDDFVDNLTESCNLPDAIYVTENANGVRVRLQTSIDPPNPPIQVISHTSFSVAALDNPAVFSVVELMPGTYFRYSLWTGTNRMVNIDAYGGITGNGTGLTNLQASAIVGGYTGILTNLVSVGVSSRTYVTNGVIMNYTQP